MKYIDDFLNQITMYRLLFYYLIFLVGAGVVLSFFKILSLDPFALLFSSLFLVFVCYIANKVFAYIFEVPANVESVYITAMILALIISPLRNIHDLPLLGWAAVWAMSTKYILALGKKHIFNPAAAAAVIVSAFGIGTANWWVGTLPMLPFVLIGVLIVYKIRRFDLVFYFLVVALFTILTLSFFRGSAPLTVLRTTLLNSPILFFAFIMLTEPLTTPPTKKLQALYGAFVGFLFTPQLHVAGFYTTPEIALVIGNVFSYIVSPKEKFILKLKEKIAVGRDLVDFTFTRPQNFRFTPGQYMEWTLSPSGSDLRGNRRYFTIASSPTEDTIRLGVKFYQNGSSYKKAMIQMGSERPIVAAQLTGDFVLPKDSSKKMAFIAGGIGVTPFRAIIKYLLDTNSKRDIVLFFSNKTADEIVYKDVFDAAQKQFGMKTVYILTDKDSIPQNWAGKTGRLDSNMIAQELTDYRERYFYLSGPHTMVDAYKNILKQMSVPNNQIIVDYFPGYA